jgi:hypothetical protein
MNDRPKNVQIPLETFIALCKVHLMGADNTDTLQAIKTSLESKLDALVKHNTYTTYKTAATDEERKQARQEYLESVGIPKNFRW